MSDLSSEMSSPPTSMLMPKRYRPPQPDQNTFGTQEEFLNSLEPVPIETVEHRRCPHCWKDYGESDPGLNNAEEPVRLRCDHVFGEKCLRDLFGLPTPVFVRMIPLSYEPGSRGADLGKRLSLWVQHRGVDKSALLLGGNRGRDFLRLISDLQGPPSGMGFTNTAAEMMGPHWHFIINHLLLPRNKVNRIHILENAVIMDLEWRSLDDTEKKATPGESIFAEFADLPHFNALLGESSVEEQTIKAMHTLQGTPPVQGDLEWASFVTSLGLSDDFSTESTSHDASSLSEAEIGQSESALLDLLDSESHAPKINIAIQNAKIAIQNSYISSDSAANAQVKPTASVQETVAKPSTTSSFDAMEDSHSKEKKIKLKLHKMKSIFSGQKSKPSPPKGDAALPTMTTDENNVSEVQVQEEKLKFVLSLMDRPGLRPYLPFPLQNAVSEGGSAGQTVKASKAFLQMLKEAGLKALQEDKKAGEAPAGVLSLKQPIPGSWKDDMPQLSHEDMVLALKDARMKAKAFIEAATKAKQESQAREARATKLRKQRQVLIKLAAECLVDTLKTVYEGYERFMHEVALAAGQPPPIKKLKLAPSNSPSSTTSTFGSSPPGSSTASTFGSSSPEHLSILPIPKTVSVSVMVHEPVTAKGYQVPVPHFGIGPYDDDSDDEMGASQADENMFYFLSRTKCRNCATPKTTSTFHELPEHISWLDVKNVPDGCPICRKVLFKKGNHEM